MIMNHLSYKKRLFFENEIDFVGLRILRLLVNVFLKILVFLLLLLRMTYYNITTKEDQLKQNAYVLNQILRNTSTKRRRIRSSTTSIDFFELRIPHQLVHVQNSPGEC